MSVQAITWALEAKIETASAKLVLICLANYADKHGVCWPGQKTLAKDSSLSERTVRSALARLEDLGFISRNYRHRDDGTRTSDYYQLNMDDNRKSLPVVKTCNRQSMQGQPATIAGQYKPKGLSEPVREPSDARARETSTPRGVLSGILKPESIKAVLEHRRLLKKPLGVRAAQLLANQLALVDDPDAAVDVMIERGWQGFKADWYHNAKSKSEGDKFNGKRFRTKAEALAALRGESDERELQKTSHCFLRR